MSSLNVEPDITETPKTLPRKKKLCKFCEETVLSKDKIIFETKFYHKQCLYKLKLNDSNLENNKVSINENLNELSTEENSFKQIPTVSNELTEKIENCDDSKLNSSCKINEEKIFTKDDFLKKNEIEKSLENLQEESLEQDNSDKLFSQCIKENSIKEDNLNPFDSDNDETNDNFFLEETKKDYPVELNPFGNESDENDDNVELSKDESFEKDDVLKNDKPQTTNNPFGDISDEENDNSKKNPTIKIYPEDLNPFAEDDDEIDQEENVDLEINCSNVENNLTPNITNFIKNSSSVSLEGYFECRKNSKQFNSFGSLGINKNKNFDTISIRSSTPEGKWRSNKKKLAPKPPILNENYSLTSLDTLSVNNINNNDNSSFLSIQSSSENENSFSSLPNSDINNSKHNSLRKKRIKKNKAPPLPPPLLRFVGSIMEIEKECNLIGDQLESNETSFKQIEKKLIDDKIEKNLTENEFSETVYECLKLIETKCSLAKKQEELMYLKRQNKLEKDQIEVDSRLRFLFKKDSKLKTFEDLREEESLLDRLVDIIEGKNEIEENIMKIDKKDEFDKCVQKIKTLNDNSKIDLIVEDYLKNDFNESNVKNKIVNLDANEKIHDPNKKKEKSKGFILKKLSKLKLST